MQKSRKLFLLVFMAFALFLIVPGADVCAKDSSQGTESTTGQKNGWVTTSKGNTYYYVDGVRQTGWQKISGKYYYFSSSGKMQTNKIVGSKKKGYYYVDTTGVRVTDSRIKSAVKFVTQNSKSSQTRRQRLKSCFKALCKYKYKHISGDKPSASKIKSYASYLFKNKKGNCYRFASAMAYIARVLGYESRVAAGGVSSHSSGSLSAHGWCEVKVGSTWKIIDCTMQRTHKDVDLFLVKKSNYPYRLRRDHTYKLTAKNGKISVKKTS